MLFLERSHGGDGEDALDAELLEAVNVGAEVQLAGQDAVAASVTREEGHAAALQRAENISLRRRAEGSFNRKARVSVSPGME